MMEDIDFTKIYFLKNKSWYKEVTDEDGDNFRYVLTEEGKKDKKVLESYKEYLRWLNNSIDFV